MAHSAVRSAGGSTNITVTFAPVALQSYGGTITVGSDATSGTSTITASGSGTAIPTRIIGLSGNLAFGNVTTGTTAHATMTIANSGNSTLTVSSIAYPTGFSGAFSGTVAAGGSTNITVTFALWPFKATGARSPSAATPPAAPRHPTRPGPGQRFRRVLIGLSGNLAFGNVTTGTTAHATMTIANSGNSTLTVSSIAYPPDLAAHSAERLRRAARPISRSRSPLWPFKATAARSPSAATPPAAPAPSALPGPDSDSDAYHRTQWQPGVRKCGHGHNCNRDVDDCEYGQLNLDGQRHQLSDGFSGDLGHATPSLEGTNGTWTIGGSFDGAIAAGGSVNVTVTFAPLAVQSYGGTVTVSSDATSGANAITASGTGTEAPTRIIGVSGNLAFGSVEVGSTGTATLTIGNSGNSALTVGSVTYPPASVGRSAARFGGGSTNVIVTFAPVAATNYSGAVTVNSDATSGADTIGASGSGTLVVPPMITSGPVVTNAWMQVGDLAIVLAGDTNVFSVTATDPGGKPLTYTWSFGDGSTTAGSPEALSEHAYSTSNCGPYTASVTVSNASAGVTTSLTVAVACQLNLTKLQAGLNFAKTNADSCTLKATVDLPSDFIFANKQVTLNVGGAGLSFPITSKGLGANGLSKFSKPSYNKKTGLWAISATLKSGSWQNQWAELGMTDSPVGKPGVAVDLPVVLIVDKEAFVGIAHLHYTATVNKSGTAK